MEITIGAPADLTARLTRNRRPWTGRSVKVRIVDRETGASLLALTVVPETADIGLYSYSWNGVPSVPTRCAAIYLIDGLREFTEFFDVVYGASSGDSIVGIVEDLDLVGTITPDEVSGSAEDGDTSGTVDDGDVSGENDENDTAGEVTC